MHKLMMQLMRLYGLPEQRVTVAGGEPQLLTPALLQDALAGECRLELEASDVARRTRVFTLSFPRPGDWPAVADFYARWQDALECPAPAISIAEESGFQLWFSLAEPVAIERLAPLLSALRQRDLANLPASAVRCWPEAGETRCRITLPPALDPASGRWSAFIDPSMGSMFIDGAWLDMAPSGDRQAEMLSAFRPISQAEFERLAGDLAESARIVPVDQSGAAINPASAGKAPGVLRSTSLNEPFDDPVSFLRAVMNDTQSSTKNRIRAARALLIAMQGKPATN